MSIAAAFSTPMVGAQAVNDDTLGALSFLHPESLNPGSVAEARTIVDRLLSVIADAEQMLADQRHRIAHLESLATTDELTGLLNRRGFREHLRREIASVRRSKEAAGVLVLCDLDGFKAINDTHGHIAGDAYLRQVARLLSESVRGTDVVARLGGDEFAVLLTRTDRESGEARAAALAAELNAATADWDGHELPIRVSIGVHTYRAGDKEDEIMRQADSRLYEAKEERRRAAGGRR